MADTAAGISLLDYFSTLKDPRQTWKIVYPLPEILLLVLAATLAGADDLSRCGCGDGSTCRFCAGSCPFAAASRADDNGQRRGQRARPRAVPALLFELGLRACARRSPTSLPSTARPRVAAMPKPRAASPCTWSRPGPAGSIWCWARRWSPASPTRSRRSRCCSRGSSLPAPWSRSTPWVARPGSPRRSWPRGPTISCR